MTVKSDTKKVKIQEDEESSEFKNLLASDAFTKIPQIGDIIKGKIISASKSEVRLDIDGFTTGIVRGREFYDESNEYTNLKEGDEVEATVVELENENGEMELSFRYAGHQKAWNNLAEMMKEEKVVPCTILDANKGGMLVKIGQINGFMPVSGS